jgi:RNA polymerase sigma-32 factor
LFFSLRRMHARLQEFNDGSLQPEHVSRIADMLRVPEHEVISMNRRMAGRDRGLNAPISVDSEERADRKSLLPSALH